MAAITVEIQPGPNGPIVVVTGGAGNTVTVNDYAHPDNGQGNAIVGPNGKRGKQTVTVL